MGQEDSQGPAEGGRRRVTDTADQGVSFSQMGATRETREAGAALGGPVSPAQWFEAAVRPERVHAALVRQVPEFASGELVLHACEVKRLHFREEMGHWTVLYRLSVDGPGPSDAPGGERLRRQVLVQGRFFPPGAAEPVAAPQGARFGAEGWDCYLPDLRLELRTGSADAALPALASLIDPERARALVESSLRSGPSRYRDLRVESCASQVVNHKPGDRCTVLCHLEYGPGAGDGGGPEMVVAKLYGDETGQKTYSAMQALWDSPLRASRCVAIAEPLAYLPESRVLIQGSLREEQNFRALLRSALRRCGADSDSSEAPAALEELHDYARATAIGLAELHRCGVRYGETVAWEGELTSVRRKRAKLAAPMPQLGDLASTLLDRLEALALQVPVDPPRPAHGGFRPAQVLLYRGAIGFIDFDKFCQAEPARDLALFTSKVKHIAFNRLSDDAGEEGGSGAAMDAETRRALLAQAKAVCDAFLLEYESHAPVARSRVMLWEALELFSLILSTIKKLKLPRLEGLTLALRDHLESLPLLR